MKRNYAFRELNPADNPVIAKIARTNLKRYGLDIPGTVYFDDALDHLYEYYFENAGSFKRGYYVLTDEADTVVGGIGFAECTFIGGASELQKLYLADSEKGQGLGYKLVEYVEERMRENGYQCSYLETHNVLQPAIHIYEKLGYKEIEKPEEVVHSAMNMFFLRQL